MGVEEVDFSDVPIGSGFRSGAAPGGPGSEPAGAFKTKTQPKVQRIFRKIKSNNLTETKHKLFCHDLSDFQISVFFPIFSGLRSGAAPGGPRSEPACASKMQRILKQVNKNNSLKKCKTLQSACSDFQFSGLSIGSRLRSAAAPGSLIRPSRSLRGPYQGLKGPIRPLEAL